MRQEKVALSQFFITASLLVLWEAVPRIGGVDESRFPPFTRVLEALYVMLAEGDIYEDFLLSFIQIIVAFGAVVTFGVSLGLFLGISNNSIGAVSSALNMSIGVPKSIFLPLFVFALGTGMTQKVIYAIPYGLPIVAIITRAGVQGVDQKRILMARSNGAKRSDIIRQIYIPSAMPSILNGLRLGLIFTVLGVIIAEMYVSEHGIGNLLVLWGRRYQVDELFGGIFLVAILTILANSIFRHFENKVRQWE